MANVDRPNGFMPVGTISGAPWQGAIRKCYSDADNLFVGDVVIKNTAGQADPKSGGAYVAVDRSTNGATDIPLGVVVGWEPNPTALHNKYHAASTTYAVYVCTAPDVILECQSDDGTPTVASVGLNFDYVIAAGSTTTGASGMELDGDTGVTTAATPLKLIGMVDSPKNDTASANMKCLVTFNMHAYKTDAGTAGL